jgi:hypothetical protein
MIDNSRLWKVLRSSSRRQSLLLGTTLYAQNGTMPLTNITLNLAQDTDINFEFQRVADSIRQQGQPMLDITAKAIQIA